MVMPMGSYGMSGASSANVYQTMKAKYGCGYADFNERPKVAGYPMDIIPKAYEPDVKRSWFGRFMDKMFN